ncbi:MAG TPA: YdeI/OmpD-associated family protein [Myxococcota bacterium]
MAAKRKTTAKKAAVKKVAKKTSAAKAAKKTTTKNAASKKAASTSSLKRAVQKMPAAIATLLDEGGLRAAYDARPAYQRNDWLAWIGRAVRDATKQKRISSMLSDLAAGHGYMGMAWSPSTMSTTHEPHE